MSQAVVHKTAVLCGRLLAMLTPEVLKVLGRYFGLYEVPNNSQKFEIRTDGSAGRHKEFEEPRSVSDANVRRILRAELHDRLIEQYPRGHFL